MNINGIEGMTGEDLASQLELGGRIVLYEYCISIVIMTFRRPSDIYFIRAGEGSVARGLGFTLLTLFLGWWGIPWGPIYTIGVLITNLSGGKDVTAEGGRQFAGWSGVTACFERYDRRSRRSRGQTGTLAPRRCLNSQALAENPGFAQGDRLGWPIRAQALGRNNR